jgi:hypothetical protein
MNGDLHLDFCGHMELVWDFEAAYIHFLVSANYIMIIFLHSTSFRCVKKCPNVFLADLQFCCGIVYMW